LKNSSFLLLALFAGSTFAQSSTELVCSYAPSQSKTVAAVSGAAGGAGATAGAIAAATGLTAVAHSSGALILTGTSGYIAGTLGTSAAVIGAAPFVVGVGLVVGGAAVTLELVCATKNHPEQVAKVHEAAAEFSRRFGDAMARTTITVGEMKKSVSPAAGRAVSQVQRTADDAWKYAYRKSVEFGQVFN
jgi:hypothetical protein